jgi:hypothetical protein
MLMAAVLESKVDLDSLVGAEKVGREEERRVVA